MVTLLVGPDKVAFVVHKARLIRRIHYFEKMFNGHFKETVDQEGTFPEDDPAAFDLLIEWVYNFNLRKIRDIHAIKDAAGDVSASWDATSFYKVAEKFMMPNLQDMIISALMRFQQAHNQLPSLAFIRRCYKETGEDSKLRLYAAYSLYYAMKQPDRQEDVWPMAGIQAILTGCDGACKDFLRLSMENELVDPRTFGACEFHVHEKGVVCSVTGKRYGGGRGKAKVAKVANGDLGAKTDAGGRGKRALDEGDEEPASKKAKKRKVGGRA